MIVLNVIYLIIMIKPFKNVFNVILPVYLAQVLLVMTVLFAVIKLGVPIILEKI